MNRSAYLTTGMAIQALSWLSNANIVIHGRDNIPDAPCIFVVNHFTRIETFILPQQIFNLTGIPVWSLADSRFFQGGFGRYIEMVGAVSTSDPQRDELIPRTLLSREADWIIFPEGSMIKTKKIVHERENTWPPIPKGQKNLIPGQLYSPCVPNSSSGIWTFMQGIPNFADRLYQYLGLSKRNAGALGSPYIVPVNLTYYPLRARENFAANTCIQR